MPRSIYNSALAASTGSSTPAFDVFANAPLTISGTDYSPYVAYRGNDATTTTWVTHVGPTLTLVPGFVGSPATIGVGTPVDGMTGVTTAVNTIWHVGGTNPLDLAVGVDCIIEVVAAFDASSYAVGNATNNSSEGVMLSTSSKQAMYVTDDVAASASILSVASLTQSTWYYMAAAFTRNGEIMVYNNRFGIDATTHTVAGDIDGNSALFRAAGIPGTDYPEPIGWIAVYRPTGLDLSTTSDFTTACDARVVQLGQTPGADFS